MAAMFFQGMLGGFVAYSQIGGSPAAAPGPNGQPPGSYTPAQTTNAATHQHAPVAQAAGGRTMDDGGSSGGVGPGAYGRFSG